jgi:hypothetical protein
MHDNDGSDAGARSRSGGSARSPAPGSGKARDCSSERAIALSGNMSVKGGNRCNRAAGASAGCERDAICEYEYVYE